jgi:DNA-directed RNA polymerase subunit RPC12/RpoP
MLTEKLCPHCNSPILTEERAYALHGVPLGRFEFYVCSVCRRVYHPAATSKKIEEAAKALGLWPGKMDEQTPLVAVQRDTGSYHFDPRAKPSESFSASTAEAPSQLKQGEKVQTTTGRRFRLAASPNLEAALNAA